DVQNRLGSKVESRLCFGRNAIGQIPQQRTPPKMAEAIGKEFTNIDGLRFQFQGRQGFRREHVPEVGEHGAKPRQAQTVAKQQAHVQGPRREYERWQLLRREGIAQVAGERPPERLGQARRRQQIQRNLRLERRRMRRGIPSLSGIWAVRHKNLDYSSAAPSARPQKPTSMLDAARASVTRLYAALRAGLPNRVI